MDGLQPSKTLCFTKKTACPYLCELAFNNDETGIDILWLEDEFVPHVGHGEYKRLLHFIRLQTEKDTF